MVVRHYVPVMADFGSLIAMAVDQSSVLLAGGCGGFWWLRTTVKSTGGRSSGIDEGVCRRTRF